MENNTGIYGQEMRILNVRWIHVAHDSGSLNDGEFFD